MATKIPQDFNSDFYRHTTSITTKRLITAANIFDSNSLASFPQSERMVGLSKFSLIFSLLPSLPKVSLSFAGDHLRLKSAVRRHSRRHEPAHERSTTRLFSSSLPSSTSSDALTDLASRLTREVQEIGACASILLSSILLDKEKVDAEEMVRMCDLIDSESATSSSEASGSSAPGESTSNLRKNLFVTRKLDLRKRALQFQRYEYFVKLMRKDYGAYVATASFLSPSRIPRRELPNLQDVPIDKNSVRTSSLPATADGGTSLVADCELDAMKYDDSLLDKLLLSIFRKLVTQNTGGITSDKPGIEGLLEQGRAFMLRPGQTPEAQHKMVSDTLGGLMTPFLPPFYRIFMSGIVPKLGTDLDGKQFGPWFYAPFLTSFVTPTFFGFLVGPSYPNRRKDGQLGGLVVEKCKFLQESGCKGLCLHQCKLPAQQFFQEELGLSLTVSPNFVTQECQWSFGETPLPPSKDPSFPKGCLVGCESRKGIAASGSNADLCN